ncbi:MAG: hypothetical protein ABWY27_14485 [Telluria sp.]
MEDRLARVEARLDLTATKADLAELRAELHLEFLGLVKWMVGTAVVLGASAITIMTFVLNYAAPPRNQAIPAGQTLAPIIIPVPPYSAPRQ